MTDSQLPNAISEIADLEQHAKNMAITCDKLRALNKEFIAALADVQKDLKFHGMGNSLVDAALAKARASA